MALNERVIPEAALRDENSVEMLRVWIAEKKLHCSMKIGMYRETTKIPEERAWGQILADVARHVAHCMSAEYGVNGVDVIQAVRESFDRELDKPTTPLDGGVIRRQRATGVRLLDIKARDGACSAGAGVSWNV